MALGFKGKKVYVYGLGKSGVTTAHALAEDGAQVCVWDDAALEDDLKEGRFITGLLTSDDAHFCNPQDVDWSLLDVIFKAPGIPMDVPFIERAVGKEKPVMGDVDLLYRREPNAQFIGVTGTNGKSTTTALIGHILKEAGYDVAVGGNIGDAVMSLPEGKEIYVVELSSYQLETMNEMKLDRAVIINLTEDHLERHGTMQNYFNMKARIFERMDDDAIKIMGVDEKEMQAFASSYALPLKTVSIIGRDADFQVTKEGDVTRGGKTIFSAGCYPALSGCHNWQNIACAFAIVRDMVSLEDFQKSLSTFHGLPHRMERVLVKGDITCINDSKATNPVAANYALDGFSHIYWIVGGQSKTEGVKPCLDHLQNVRAAFVVGENREGFVNDLQGRVEIYDCGTMDKAVEEAWRLAHKEGLENACILLAPACASWDQFKSFIHRGDVFSSLCRERASLSES